MVQHDEWQRETPPYGAPQPTPDPSRGPGRAERRGRVALLLAVPGLVLSFLYFPLGLVLDIVAIVAGVRALRAARGRRGRAPGAVWGLVVGAVGVVLAGSMATMYVAFRHEIDAYQQCRSGANTIEAQQRCYASLKDALEQRLGVDVNIPTNLP